MTRKVFDEASYRARLDALQKPLSGTLELKLIVKGEVFAHDAIQQAKVNALKQAKQKLKRAIAEEESKRFLERPLTQQITVDLSGGEDEELVGL